ncbi:MAG: DMT family transporter [Rhodobacteraceae bacterium]|nr:DMT family transporter [Paracoccaceae bacterium]
MLLFSALVAGSFSLGSMMANDIDPMALTAARFAIAAVVIGTVASVTTGFSRQSFAAPWRYLVLGGLFAAYFVLMFWGLKTAPPISTVAVFTLTPIMTAGFGWLLLRQVTTPRMSLALAIGAVGAVWVIFRADWSVLTAFELGGGELIYFIGCISHALYVPMVRKLNRGEPAIVFTFGMLFAGFVILAIVGWSEIIATDWFALPWLVWVTLFYLAIFASAASFVLLQFSILRLPSAKVMAYSYLTPTWVIVWEIMLGHGVPAGLILVGIAMTVVALVMLLKNEEVSLTPARPLKTAQTHPD